MNTPKRLLLLLCFCSFFSKAQVLPSDTVPAKIKFENLPQGLRFDSELRPLRGVAGAPAPFYTYFWEFGDGSFSFEQNPTHQFNRDSVMVRLYATNNYDDGKRPPTKPRPIKTGSSRPMLASNTGMFGQDEDILLKTNCMPKPNDELILVIGYRNSTGLPSTSGTLALFFNDTEFNRKNFDLIDARTYNSEFPIKITESGLPQSAKTKSKNQLLYWASADKSSFLPSIAQKIVLAEKLKNFKDHKAWHFQNLKNKEERYAFISFKTTPEMLKDTNAILRIGAAMIPDNPSLETSYTQIELQIVASHDPNKMSLRKSRMNYRFTGKNRELTYKIRFQNTGKGPAKRIDVASKIAEVFDPSTIKITATKPQVTTCDSAYANQSCLKYILQGDSAHFVFTNIYLPGTQQKGVNDADSTQGFVEYKIKFKEKPEKLPIKSGAAIVFDKNEPIYTNRATGRFKMGLSPGVIVGYGFPFDTNNQSFLSRKNVVVGASLSPYAPHRFYWQAELYLNSFNENTFLVAGNTTSKDTVINRVPYQVLAKDHYKIQKVLTINVVPIQARYNINKFMGVGLGAFLSVDLNKKEQDELRYTLQSASAQGTVGTISNLNILANNVKNAFSDWRTTAFADVQLGLVRVGPAVGFRYLYDIGAGTNRMTTYITWKF